MKGSHLPLTHAERYSQVAQTHDKYLKALQDVEHDRLTEGKEPSAPRYHWEMPWFWNKFMLDANNLNLPKDRTFLGYNNPHPSYIGIDNESHFERLLEHLRDRTVCE